MASAEFFPSIWRIQDRNINIWNGKKINHFIHLFVMTFKFNSDLIRWAGNSLWCTRENQLQALPFAFSVFLNYILTLPAISPFVLNRTLRIKHRSHFLTSMQFCLSIQGDRGFDGPKGPRGQPGIGIKGEKVSSKYARGFAKSKWPVTDSSHKECNEAK